MDDTRHTQHRQKKKKNGKKLIVAGGLISFEQTVLKFFLRIFALSLTKSNSLARSLACLYRRFLFSWLMCILISKKK